jgi:hypothetical protein
MATTRWTPGGFWWVGIAKLAGILSRIVMGSGLRDSFLAE